MRKLLAAHILGSPFGAATSRGDVAQRPVSAAASVGAGRLPLADSTRGGRRECPPREGGEGKPLARSPASGKLPSRCAAVREKRFAVSLAFSHALRAYKGKVVGLCPTPRKLFEKSLTKNFYARSARLLARTCAILSMSTSGSELPKARIESPGTGQNFYARYRSAPLCTCVA